MNRIEIPPLDDFKDAEALTERFEKSDHRDTWDRGDLEPLMKVLGYYKALLDRLMSTPRSQLLALAEKYAKMEETGMGGPCGEDETSDWLDIMMDAYRFYKSQYDMGRTGLGTFTTGHEALMRKPGEPTAEYLGRVTEAVKDFGAALAAQVGRERFLRPEDEPPMSAEEADSIGLNRYGEIVQDDPEPFETEGWKEAVARIVPMRRSFAAPYLMSGIRFEHAIMQNLPTVKVDRRTKGKYDTYTVTAPAPASEDVEKFAKVCGMDPMGTEWTPVVEDEEERCPEEEEPSK